MSIRGLWSMVPVLMAVSLAVPPAWSAEPAAARLPNDLAQLRARDLIPSTTPEQLRTKAMEAHTAGHWVDAARAWVALLHEDPGNSTALYNLACCYARLGAPEQAAEFVAAAWGAGFRDLAQLRRDADFAGVRTSPSFVALLRLLEAQKVRDEQAAGEALEVPATVESTVRVTAPTKELAAPPLVVGLHGWGANAEDFVGLFRRAGMAQPFVMAAPDGPYATPGSRMPGHSWFLTEGDGRKPQPESLRETEAYVLRAVAAVRARGGVRPDRAVVMGFSQGAHLALQIALDHPEAFAGAVVIGGWLDADALPPSTLEAARGKVRVLLCASPDDRAVPPSNADDAKGFLASHGIDAEIFHYAGGHAVTREVLERAAHFVAEVEGKATPPGRNP